MSGRGKHIQHTRADMRQQAWCGEALTQFDWTFQDLDHAAYSVQANTLVQPCPACIKAAVAALNGQK